MVDALDRRIVDALARDGRRPFVRIAADLGVSEASVRQRVARLQADGVMQIVAVTNPLKLGYSVLCLLGLEIDHAELDAAGRALQALDEVTYLLVCTGRYNLLAEVVCRDDRHLMEFLTGSLAAVPGVRGSETWSCLAVLKESYRTSGEPT
jgi:Lrp/AsnC family transcriptional regulator, regulator for asnA, asnC and gidA